MIPQTGWVPQSLKIVPKTDWTKKWVAEYGRYFYQMLCSATIGFEMPQGASSYMINLVPARLCGAFTSLDVTYHGGACGGKSTYNQTVSPIELGLYCAAGDLVYCTISIFDSAGNYSYSAPFSFQQPLGENDPEYDPAFIPYTQVPGSMETDYCKNIVTIRTGSTPPPTVAATPKKKGNGK